MSSNAGVPADRLLPEEEDQGLAALRKFRVALFIVTYNAERHLESVLKRIPPRTLETLAEIFVIDDSSTDATFDVARSLRERYAGFPIQVYRTPFNRGYGGNQKLGYQYCINKGFDFVILLHGDGQYAPEFIPRIASALGDGVDAVFASRMINKRLALKGGMPFYKWIGNQILTGMENRALGMDLSEFHTGFRAYSVAALRSIPFQYNSDDFHFDTEIIIQAAAMKWNIREVPIPTHYGDEVCHVNGLKYAYHCMNSVISYRLVNLGLFYKRNFDCRLFETENAEYKQSAHSLHQHVLQRGDLDSFERTIELGAGSGILSSRIAEHTKAHVAAGFRLPERCGKATPAAVDFNSGFSAALGRSAYDCCLALDLIEHLENPERFLEEVHGMLKPAGRLYISTANIAYISMRLALLLGQFNYGKRGILDRTHKRLFSVRSFCELLRQYGFRVESIRGFPPPLVDLISRSVIIHAAEKVHALFSRIFPRLFSYNFLVVATRMDDVSDILEKTTHQT